MPLLDHVPAVDRCCGCITDLKTATVVIVVLSIVTSPLVSWAMVRHAYVIRVSCVVTTNAKRPDVVDINFHNGLSFGFGANAGLGPSCFARNSTEEESELESGFVLFVKHSGWLVLAADVVFLITSVLFLIKIFKGHDKEASRVFLISALSAVLLSFVYGLLYVIVCMTSGGNFPVFELFFAVIDFMICIVWLYFAVVVYRYYLTSNIQLKGYRIFDYITYPMYMIYEYTTYCAPTCVRRKT